MSTTVSDLELLAQTRQRLDAFQAAATARHSTYDDATRAGMLRNLQLIGWHVKACCELLEAGGKLKG